MNTKPNGHHVREVTGIRLERLKTLPPRLRVAVVGTVPSTGWSNPHLFPYTYVQAPPDGIYDYDFVATPPAVVMDKLITPIRLTTELPATGVRGIRVHAALNSKEALLEPEQIPVEKV
jgi:tRNA G26 N,N-dimethylase Trm1